MGDGRGDKAYLRHRVRSGSRDCALDHRARLLRCARARNSVGAAGALAAAEHRGKGRRVSAVRFTVGLLMVGACSGVFAKREANPSRLTVTRLREGPVAFSTYTGVRDS